MSILVRLALANGMRDVGHLLRSTPHLRIKQVLNRETRIEVAGRLSGFDVAGIDGATPIRMTGGQMGGTRARLFGRAVVDGERLSLTQAAKVVGVADSLLANILVALDADFRPAVSGPTLLDRAQLLAARDAIRGTMRSTAMKAVLGFDRHMMALAIERGFLRCLIPPAQGHFGLVWRRDVARLLRLFGRVPVVATDGLLAPAPFARSGGVSTAEIMAGVVEGRLRPAGRRHDVPGFQGLLFDPSAAAGLWAALRGEMPRRRLAETLGWMPRTIPELQRRGLLRVEGQDTVRIDALKSFRSRYASADEARGWLESPPGGTGPMHALLRELCGQPVVAGKGVTAFWPRSSMAAKLRPLLRADANIHAIGFGSRDYPRNRRLQTRNRCRETTQNSRF